MLLAWAATAYCLHGLMADGTMTPSFANGNPRILAASVVDLDAGRVHMGDRVCVQFKGGDRYTYRVSDACPSWSCPAGTVDLLVATTQRAREFGRQPVTVTLGRCL